MSAFWGMDPAQLRSHAGRLDAASADVERLASRLADAVHAASWTGPDAEQLRTGWTQLSAQRIETMRTELLALGDEARHEADQQDAASRAETGPAVPEPLSSPLAEVSDPAPKGLPAPRPWLPGPLAQFQRDAEHLGGILEEWATGERVPTIAEVVAASLVTAGSAGVGVYESVTGGDTALLDDRPGGVVDSVHTDPTPAQGPRTLQDLVVRNDALRMDNPTGATLAAGQIGIQEVHRSSGAEPAYIVQVPPTEGAGVFDVPGSYGGQGNSRGWGSNLRLVAGQHPAAMDDVRAAMEAAGVPPGAEVLIVGHSQGGIIANHLAADPTFNSPSGAAGTYDVTHTFAIGAPVQTVVPAQATTLSVNAHHGAGISADGVSGDLIAGLDLGGAQVDGGTLESPNRLEVPLPGYPVPSLHPLRVLEANHDSMGADGRADAGYSGSIDRAVSTDPTLSALQEELTGSYLGEGTQVASSHVVTVGRGEA